MSEKLKIQVDLKKVEREDNPEFRGYANLTIGDIAIRDVAISEIETEKGKDVRFSFPSRTYEKDGETKFAPIVSLIDREESKEIKNTMVKDIKKAIVNALTSEAITEENGFTHYKGEVESNLDHRQNQVTAFVRPYDNEEYPNLRAFANIYVEGVLEVNGISFSEIEKDESLESRINFPSKSYEAEEGKKFKDIVFPVTADLRTAIQDKIEEGYCNAIENVQDNNIEEDEPEI